MRLARFASGGASSLGRALDEPPSAMRSPFQRDRDRIVHSTAFRRLEYKTQVLVNFEGDHFRTRLTHTLEVAQIARTLARALLVDEDLAEAVALAHDLGHSPFGHAGEAALDRALAASGGFDHNLQTFRIVTDLERRYALFDGLNLCFETLEGIVKHNGALCRAPPPVAAHALAAVVALDAQAPIEAQLASLADDVAYCNHDLDDGLRARFFALDQLEGVPLVADLLAEVRGRHPGIEQPRLVHETKRRLIDRMVADIVAETRRRLARFDPVSVEQVRAQREPTVAFSPAMAETIQALRLFLQDRMYRHYKVNRMTLKARRLVEDLVDVFMGAPECLPDGWRERAGSPGSVETAGVVRDYIAGMTDRYALDEHDRLFKLTRSRA